MPRTRSFDGEAFYAALDAERLARGLTSRKVAEQAGVSASTLTRMGQGKHPDVNSLASLCGWAGLRADDYMIGAPTKAEAEPLTMISTWLRKDPKLSPESVIALEEVLKATYTRLRK